MTPEIVAQVVLTLLQSVRRGGTPESEAVVSSEDERPWPSSTSFGSLPHKENGVPGLGGGIWSSSSQKRGSFKLSETAQRNAAREARLAAPSSHGALRSANTPSPSTDGPGALPFAIPLQPTPKTHRSLSHSHGQREAAQIAGAAGGQASGGALPLDLLAEDNETDADEESEYGNHLTHTVSHPPIGALQRSATYSTAYGTSSGYMNGRGSDYSDHRLQAALSQLSLGVSALLNIFMAVSAFCNAGFDPLGNSSMIGLQTQPVVIWTIISLVILGGIGFSVWFDVANQMKKFDRSRPKSALKKAIRQLRPHTKLALKMTILIITLGTFLFLAFEWNNTGTIGEMSIGNKFMTAVFQTVTMRTAGFASIDYTLAHPVSILIFIVTMFIGGSPGGTAGGLKTTTFALVLMLLILFQK